MTENQKKTYCRWMQFILILLIASVGYLVICSNYGKPVIVEFSDCRCK